MTVVGLSQRIASATTEATSPTVLAPLLLIVVALDQFQDRGPAAIGWGALAALFAGALPLGFLRWGTRRGRWADHHVDDRSARPLPLFFAMASVAAGTAILYALNAPKDVTALIIAMFCGLIVVLVVNHWWKVSIHSAVGGGSAVILGIVFGWIGIVVGVAVAGAAAGSRVVLAKHSVGQVVSGLIVGAFIAGIVFPLLR